MISERMPFTAGKQPWLNGLHTVGRIYITRV
jgi:hypothetical protein